MIIDQLASHLLCPDCYQFSISYGGLYDVYRRQICEYRYQLSRTNYNGHCYELLYVNQVLTEHRRTAISSDAELK